MDPVLAGDCFAARGQSIALPLRAARNDIRGARGATPSPSGGGLGWGHQPAQRFVPLAQPLRAGFQTDVLSALERQWERS